MMERILNRTPQPPTPARWPASGDPDPTESCDRCNAAALVVFEHDGDGATLAFCGHHADKKLDPLLAQGWGIISDTRAQLN